MRARAITYVANIQRRISGAARFVLARIRLSAIYAGLAIVLAAAWGANALGSLEPASAPKPPAAASKSAQTPLTPDTPGEGDQSSMPATTPDANNTNNTHASVQTTDGGTTVTVNGDTATIPPNQRFQQSYDTSDNGTVTHTDVSVENNTAASGRSVTLHMEAQSQSSVSGMNANGG